MGVHLGLLRQCRCAQLGQFSDFLRAGDGNATVIIGDVDERSLSVVLGRLRPNFSIMDPGPTVHSRRATSALDRIAYSSHLTTKSVGILLEVEVRLGSDHQPIFAGMPFTT